MRSSPLTPRKIEASARTLITVVPSALGAEVTTPVVYPNGQCVVVIVAEESPRYVVHDAGLGSMYLEREGIRLTRETEARAATLAARYDCLFANGRMARPCEADDVAVSVMLVANASRSMGDLALETRRQTENQFRYVLTERVREIVGSRLRENEVFKGKSSASYRVANTILDAARREPVAFVVPVASRGSVANQFRELFDLREAFPDVLRESVYDEKSDFRPVEDGWMLSQVGGVTPLGDIPHRIPALIGNAPAQHLLSH